MGCSSGPNALTAVAQVMDTVDKICRRRSRQSPTFMMYLNDLPGNDFNEVFVGLPNFYRKIKEENGEDFGPCYIAAVPGTFHGRLFPENTLHFVHSSCSLHWLSQVPPSLESKKSRSEVVNKGKVYISRTSPARVAEAYCSQFAKDFFSFLTSRSEELVPGGHMVLSMLGRQDADPAAEEGCSHWDLIAKSLMSLVSEGRIEEEKVDAFNVPHYAPSREEIEKIIKHEGSFDIHVLEAMEINWDEGYEHEIGGKLMKNLTTRGEKVAKVHRAVTESLLEFHFGRDIIDDLFFRYSKIVDIHLSNKDAKFVVLVVSLSRKLS